MDLLLSVQSVTERLVISQELTGVEPAILSAMRAAQLRIQSELETDFAKASYTDVFYLDASLHSGVIPNGVFRLQLKNGLLRNSPTPTIYTGSTWKSQTELVDSENYQIDKVRGVVSIDKEFADTYVKVSYEAGFDDTDIQTNSIPSWLEEAILAYIPAMLNSTQITNRNVEAEKMYQTNIDHAIGVLIPYRRKLGFCLRPVY